MARAKRPVVKNGHGKHGRGAAKLKKGQRAVVGCRRVVLKEVKKKDNKRPIGGRSSSGSSKGADADLPAPGSFTIETEIDEEVRVVRVGDELVRLDSYLNSIIGGDAEEVEGVVKDRFDRNPSGDNSIPD